MNKFKFLEKLGLIIKYKTPNEIKESKSKKAILVVEEQKDGKFELTLSPKMWKEIGMEK